MILMLSSNIGFSQFSKSTTKESKSEKLNDTIPPSKLDSIHITRNETLLNDSFLNDSFPNKLILRDTSRTAIDSVSSSIDTNRVISDTLALRNDSIASPLDIESAKVKLKIIRPWHGPMDSLSAYYIYDLDPTLHLYKDTVLSIDFHEEDLVRRSNNHYFHLGNVGSSSNSFKFKLKDNINKDIGFHQYDLYNKPIDSFKHYLVVKPYSHAYYNTGAIKNNFSTGIKFANQYAGDTHFSIDFKRINFEGIYKTQQTKHSNLNAAVFWNHNRYQLFVLFHNRSNLESFNGGILDSLVGNSVLNSDVNKIRINVTTKLQDSKARHYQSGMKITNKYSLFHKNKSALVVYHQLGYAHRTFKYADKDVNSILSGSYYGHFVKDKRGIRLYLDQKTISNGFGTIVNNTKYYKLDVQLRHQYHYIQNESFKEKSQILDLIAHAQFKLGRWNNYGKLQFNIAGLENNSNFTIGSFLDFGKYGGKLAASYQNLRKSPSYIQQNLILNKLPFWNQSFDIQFSNSIGISYQNSYTHTAIEAKTIFLNNHIYLDTSQTFVQEKSTLNIQQLSASQSFKIRNIHSRHEILLQRSSSQIFALPQLYTKHDLYWVYQLKSSTKAIKIGANVKYYKGDRILQHQALLGAFYPSVQSFEDYWTSDIYLSMKISSFRLYVQYQNIDQLLDNKVDYQILNNPQADGIVLFGINWILYD